MIINILSLVYILTVAVLFLASILIVVVWTQISIFKKYSELKKSNDHLRLSLADEESKVLIKARQEADEIISNAIKQAAGIEKNAQINQVEFSKLLENRVERVTNDSSEKLQTALNNIQTDFQNVLSKQAGENIIRLKEASKDFESRNLKEMEEQLAKLKEDRIKKLEESIFNIVKNASFEIINGSIDLSLHEELITSAVEKAVKKEGL